MSLTQERKQEIMAAHQLHATDTGSSDLQVAMLTERINRLSAGLRVEQLLRKKLFEPCVQFPIGNVADDLPPAR